MKRYLKFALTGLLLTLTPQLVVAQTSVPTAFFGMSVYASSYPLGSGITLGTEGKTWGQNAYNIDPACDGGGDPSNACYNWTQMDIWVDNATANGWTLIYDWDGMPLWMCPSQAGGTRCTTTPNMTAVSHLATAIATRYRGKIKYYETYNEMNEGYEWTGTCTDLVLLHNNVRNAIKAADPDALVGAPNVTIGHAGLSGGCTNSPNPNGVLDEWIYVQNFLATADPNGNKPVVDTIGVHLYASTSAPLDSVAQYTLNRYADFRSTATGAGIPTTTPVLVTEGSWGEDNPNNNCSAPLNTTGCLSAQDQIAYVGRYLVVLASTFSDGGGTLANWYDFDSTWGTLNGTNGMNPQNAPAYGQMEGWLTGATFSQQCLPSTPSTLFVCDYTVGGEKREVVFNDNNGSTASYTPPGWAAYYKQLLGAQTSVTGAITVGNTPILLTALGTETSAGVPTPPRSLTATIR